MPTPVTAPLETAAKAAKSLELTRASVAVVAIDAAVTWEKTLVARAAQLEAERDEARKLASYAYRRWPAPIFWQAAAEIESPFTALPWWLTADEATTTETGDQK